MDAADGWRQPALTVAVDNVHMHYKVRASQASPQSPAKTRLARAVTGRRAAVVVRALGGVSLAASRGESVGIIGANGSGKSTLLRAIAGLETPSRGQVLSASTPVLLGVNAALLPELSGAENAILGCLAMGLSPSRAREVLPDILDLAGIGASIDLPMKTYSSGMGSRLRFAIAAAAHPQILLIDEALGTGDASFSARSQSTMDELRREAGTVFLVSHAAQTIEEMCSRAVWLHKGKVVLDGPAEETARRYRLWAWSIAQGDLDKASGLFREAIEDGRDDGVTFATRDSRGNPPRHVRRKPAGAARARR